MLILTILLSLALAALFTLLPARIHHRRPTCADLYAGAGVSALVWLWAVCVWSKPGLSVGFDAFRLAAIVIMQAIACGVVCGFRLRGTLPRKLRTPAAVGLLLAASLGIELFVGNLNWLATHSYTPVDLRPYLVNDADPAAPLTLNDEQTTLEFAGLDFAIYNLQLDGLTSLADGDTPEQKNVLLTLNVAATDEASSVSRQSWNWEAAPASARSQTHSLDLSGKASTLTLTASGYTGEYRSYPLNAQLTTVYANARRPLDFSVLRFAVIFALALAAFALRPASAAWQDAYLTHEKKYRPAVLAVGLAAALVFARLARGGWAQRLLPRAGCTVLGALALVWLNAQLRTQAYAAEFQRYQLVNRMPLALAAAAVLVGFGLGLTLPRPVRRALAWLSALTYSFYLWHQQLTVFLKYDLHLPAWTGTTPPNQLGDTAWMRRAEALYWLAALAVSIAAYYLIEKPAARHFKKTPQKMHAEKAR